jgi:hypothetical protein
MLLADELVQGARAHTVSQGAVAGDLRGEFATSFIE